MKPSRDAGFTLLEAIISLAFIASVLGSIVIVTTDNFSAQRDRVAAHQLLDLARAYHHYVQNNQAALTIATSSGPFELPIGALTAGQYLPPNFPPTNALQQTYRLLVTLNSDGLPTGFIGTTGGVPLSLLRSISIATSLGGAAASVPATGAIHGITNGWSLDPATFIAAGIPITANALVLSAVHSRETDAKNLVSRTKIPGQPDATKALAPVNFNGFDLRAAGSIVSQNLNSGDITAALDIQAGLNINASQSIVATRNLAGMNIAAGGSVQAAADMSAARDVRSKQTATGGLIAQFLSTVSTAAANFASALATAPTITSGSTTTATSATATTTVAIASNGDNTAAQVVAAGSTNASSATLSAGTVALGAQVTGVTSAANISSAGAVIDTASIRALTVGGQCIGCPAPIGP